MSELTNKIDFAVVFSVTHANPNGDPINGNRPRETYDGLGEISDVCLKRKIRNRLMDMGESVFVQSDDKCNDGYKSLSERVGSVPKLKQEKDKDKYAQIACEKWIDVRSFGQVFAFRAKEAGSGVSVGVRGPVTIQSAYSCDVIEINDMQITKSVNSMNETASDRMGMKYSVNFGLYVTKGSINCQLAEKTGFSNEDAEKIKQALISLFENDASSARPEGTMEVIKVFWWKHNCKTGQYSSAKVHRSLQVKLKDGIDTPKSADDYDISVTPLTDLSVEEYEGI
jgi:CRISPR-associated protein Csd2